MVVDKTYRWAMILDADSNGSASVIRAHAIPIDRLFGQHTGVGLELKLTLLDIDPLHGGKNCRKAHWGETGQYQGRLVKGAEARQISKSATDRSRPAKFRNDAGASAATSGDRLAG